MTTLLKSLCAVCMLMSTNLFAQQEAPDTAVFNRIRNAELTSSQIPYLAHYLSDVAGPRLTGSPGFKRAGNWTVDVLKKWGLVNAKLESWGEFGKNWELQDFHLILKIPYTQPILAFPDPWSANTNGLQQARVVALTRAQVVDTAYLRQHINDYKGKIILAVDEAPAESVNKAEGPALLIKRFTDTELSNLDDVDMLPESLIQKVISSAKQSNDAQLLLKKAGAIALIRSHYSNRNGSVISSSLTNTYRAFSYNAPELPGATMAFEDAQKIKRLIRSGHPVEIALNIKARLAVDDNKGYNVIAEIPGTDPALKSQVVMLGGHLDSWSFSTGASDNVAGCVVALEAVRLLDSLGLKPKRTIRIALWGGEEEGLYGSYKYVQQHFMDAHTYVVKPAQAIISAYFNLDNGSGKIRGIFAQGNTAAASIFNEWLKPFHDLGAGTVTIKNTGATDHLSFDWAGIPAFQFIQDPLDYVTRTHHSNMDNYDHLHIEDLKQAAIILASFVYQSSVKPDLLPRKPLIKEPFAWGDL
jgi:carboxypeptidase Q